MMPRLLALLSRFSPNSVGTWTHNGLIDASSAAGGQIKFPATQNASADANTLDDYEEGSWTPSIGGTATYSFQVGRYTKIGNMVAIQMDLQINLVGSGSTTTITGLPFAPALNASLAVSNFASSATNITALMARIAATGTTIDLLSTTAAQASVASNAIFANNARVMISGIYFV